jgi:hypothetical protein
MDVSPVADTFWFTHYSRLPQRCLRITIHPEDTCLAVRKIVGNIVMPVRIAGAELAQIQIGRGKPQFS